VSSSGPTRVWRTARAGLLALAACRPAPPSAGPAAGPLAGIEREYEAARYWDDRVRLEESRGGAPDPTGLAVRDSLVAARARLTAALAGRPVSGDSADRRALATITDWLAQSSAAAGAPAGMEPDTTCPPDARDPDLARLTARVLACYTQAANTIIVDGDTLNRLAILGRLSRTGDAARRRRLFLALEPVWRSINGDDGATSPYRALLRLRREAWGDSASPLDLKGPAFGLSPTEVEAWLVRMLEAWRAMSPDSLVEPWDWYYLAGTASRRLSPRIPAVADLRRVNDAWYRDLGADPPRLGVHYDLEARPGKYPVAFTDFGARPHRTPTGRSPGEPWVFTSYLGGGLDNLAELLHETGHAVHMAAIDTRPAWTDWPDNDTFTEALADVPALELFEPAWQLRYLGDSVPLAQSLRGKYAGIVMDVAWGLFEIRVHRDPAADPNAVWAAIMREDLRIVPHPELSWWAMRGQLVDGPGYLINYALGAFITADIRATDARARGPLLQADSTRYSALSRSLYRFGLEQSAREVLERFLGRPLGPDALLADLARTASVP
jgi:hypothetical protein